LATLCIAPIREDFDRYPSFVPTTTSYFDRLSIETIQPAQQTKLFNGVSPVHHGLASEAALQKNAFQRSAPSKTKWAISTVNALLSFYE
jgi:hypothetical protein